VGTLCRFLTTLRLPRSLRKLAALARDGGISAARATFDIRSVPLAVAAYDETSAKTGTAIGRAPCRITVIAGTRPVALFWHCSSQQPD
jgi:hypothetical protein